MTLPDKESEGAQPSLTASIGILPETREIPLKTDLGWRCSVTGGGVEENRRWGPPDEAAVSSRPARDVLPSCSLCGLAIPGLGCRERPWSGRIDPSVVSGAAGRQGEARSGGEETYRPPHQSRRDPPV